MLTIPWEIVSMFLGKRGYLGFLAAGPLGEQRPGRMFQFDIDLGAHALAQAVPQPR